MTALFSLRRTIWPWPAPAEAGGVGEVDRAAAPVVYGDRGDPAQAASSGLDGWGRAEGRQLSIVSPEFWPGILDDPHLMAAVRYVELNPVRARLAGRAEDWPWSSARAHVTGRPDGLTDLAALAGVHRNWGAMLRRGPEAGDADEGEGAAIEAHIRTGRARGDASFVEALEVRTGRNLRRGKPGPKPKGCN